MKFLQVPKLAELTSFLSTLEIGDQILTGIVEAYSCKATLSEKKMTKKLRNEYHQGSVAGGKTESTEHVDPLSHEDKRRKMGSNSGNKYEVLKSFDVPRSRSISFSQCGAYSVPGEELSAAGANPISLGPMSDPTVRTLLVYLTGTMNAVFHDYDFSGLKADRFVRHSSYKDVMPVINKNFAEIVEQQGTSNGFLKLLWDALDDAICVKECEVFSYLPGDDDPTALSGNLWSLNYFFYNLHLNRIVYLMCVANSKFRSVELNSSDPDDFEDGSDLESFDCDSSNDLSDKQQHKIHNI
jgi:hypothetical protein